MALLIIKVEVEDGDPSLDPNHGSGLSNDAYERLTMHTSEHGAGALMWLGEVQDTELVQTGEHLI